MKKIFIICSTFMLLAATAYGHGNISKLPDSVQILQYKMKLYMNAEDIDSRNNLAMAYYRTNQLEEAKKQLDYIIKKDAINFDALDGMGIVLLKMGRDHEAIKWLNKAVVINQQDVMVHVHLAVYYKKMRMADKADKEMAKAESLVADPEKLKDLDKEIEIMSGLQ